MNDEAWFDHGPAKDRKDAERLAAWMRRGEFPAKIEKKADGKWHVLSGRGQGAR